MNNIRRILLLTVVIASLIALTTPLLGEENDENAPALQTVIAEGVGAGTDKAKARDEAIADAQRRAVEQGVGLYIKSETLVANFELIEDSIYRHSEGYVHTYEIVSENYDTEKELYWVKIKADVRTGKLEEDLDDLWERLRVAGNPRVLIDIEQVSSIADPDLVRSTITDELVSLGFEVFDEGYLDKARENTALKMLRGGNINAVSVMALQGKSDVVIVGRAICNTPELLMGDPAVYSCRASVNGRAISVDTGQIITSAIGYSTKSGFSSERAAAAALEAAGKNWVKENLGLIVKKVVDPAHDYLLKISNCTYEDLQAIEEGLVDIRFVRQSNLLAFDQGFAQIEVQYVGDAKTLADSISEVENIELHIDSITENSISVQVK